MTDTRFVCLPYPSRTMVQVGDRRALRYHVEVTDALLRCGLPAAQSALRAAVTRLGVVRAGLHVGGLVLPRTSSSHLDELRREVFDNWELLRERSGRLPPRPGELTVLALSRSAGWLVFVFAGAPDPLLVCKVPVGTGSQLDAEADTLERLSALERVPRALGRLGPARVQEAMPGRPLALRPLSVDDAGDASWMPELTDAAAAVQEVVDLTRRRRATGPFVELDEEAQRWLSVSTIERVALAARRLTGFPHESVCHGDLSPQNLLTSDGSVTGLIDWELARRGAPGSDVLNLAHSVFEQRLGLTRWRAAEVVAAFRTAWERSPLFMTGRGLASQAVTSGDASMESVTDLEVAFYARRLQRRVARPQAYKTGPWLAARQLEHVCAC